LGVRIRREFESREDKTEYRRILVTYKARELYDGVEVNDEREFEIKPEAAESGVSGPGDEVPDRGLGAFEDLLRRFGLRPAIHKRKRGWAWDCGGIRAELSRVDNLGWFIELEIIREREELAGPGGLPGGSGKESPGAEGTVTIEECRNSLLSLLDRLEIPRSGIESRPYTAMLAEKARQNGAG
jgi:adenylate cyclase class 2